MMESENAEVVLYTEVANTLRYAEMELIDDYPH